MFFRAPNHNINMLSTGLPWGLPRGHYGRVGCGPHFSDLATSELSAGFRQATRPPAFVPLAYLSAFGRVSPTAAPVARQNRISNDGNDFARRRPGGGEWAITD